jgi:MoCo/4Fe-4S cofactor protein with predicted Tat translocation signal
MSTTPRQWRSLRVLTDAEAAAAYRDGEFPPGADEAPDAMSRRQALGLMGATLSIAGLTACRRPEEHIVPYVDMPESVVPGVPTWYATTMPAGTTAYGILVESHEGRPTKIEGNELHPSTAGASSGRIQSAIFDLYDPDRSRFVTKRGEGSSWAEFVNAWKELAKGHEADGGAGLAVVSEPFSSPTQARLVAAFRQRWPKARWIAHAPLASLNATEAAGRPMATTYQLDKARVIVALDSDILMTHTEMVRHTQGFAAGRRTAGEHAMNRLWVVEGAHTVTGANADHRLRLSTRLVPQFTAAQQAAVSGGNVAPPPGVQPAFMKALVQDLTANRGASVIIAGRRQPASVHAAVAALNATLGNVGQTVIQRETPDALPPGRGEMRALVDAMKGGQIQTLVVMGANPAYDAAADLGFADAAKKVGNLVHVGQHVDETAALASWHVPTAHFLEAWGDARSIDGTRSVVQPLIAPLYGGKSAIEVTSLFATGEEKTGHDLVRETWQPMLPGDFEARWRRVLHDGLLAEADVVAGTPAAAAGSSALADDAARWAAGGAGTMELVFQPCPKLFDGKSANNAWLQETPDPMTKVTWDNPLLLSPATAAAANVKDGDIVRVKANGRSLELPVFALPGMADGTLVATLGYGRKAAGRVGNGVGYDTYALRTEQGGDVVVGATLEKTGATMLLSQTQEHGWMHPTDGTPGPDRPLVREATLAAYGKEPDFAREADKENPPLFNLWKDHTYDTGHQWGMAIDLNSCTGCNACVVACQSENNVPVVGKEQVRRGREMAWIRIDRYFTGEPADASAVFQPVPCMHCENAPCEQVCPVAATVHDHEGLNTMVYNRCIGTRYCSNNCPYKVRRFNFFNYTKDTPETLKMANNPDVSVRSRGVMEKCTYCVQRINRGRQEAKLEGRDMRDGDVKTACQQACPAQAITFGDLRDPQSAVAKAKGGNRNYALLAELNTRPRTTYLAKIRNPHPDLAGTAHDEPRAHA